MLAPVMNAQEICEFPHFLERGSIREIDDPNYGRMKLATMPVERKASGQGAASWPFRYGPSSETSRHVSPVLAERTSASF